MLGNIVISKSELFRIPSIAQLVERWTVDVTAIHRSLVQIRFEGNAFNNYIQLYTLKIYRNISSNAFNEINGRKISS